MVVCILKPLMNTLSIPILLQLTFYQRLIDNKWRVYLPKSRKTSLGQVTIEKQLNYFQQDESLMLLLTLILTIAAYLIGSISSAILVCNLLGLPDPRTQGSKNPGATNVYRIGGKAAAGAVLVFDILKGALPVWGAYFLKVEPIYLGLIALATSLGHMYPLFFQFKGGKAVATAFGAFLPIGLDLGGLLIVTWLAVIKFTRYSSLAAIVTVSLAPVYIWLLKPAYTYPAIMLSTLIIIRHKDNIMRLLKGIEPKVTDKKLVNK